MTPTPIVAEVRDVSSNSIEGFLKIFEFGIDPNVFLEKNSEIIEALQKINLEVQDYQKFFKEPDGIKVFDICFQLISKFAQSMGQGRNLGAATKGTIKLAIKGAEDEKTRLIMLNQYGIMEVLAMLFNPNLPHPDIKLLLSAIEIFSRSIKISWKSPQLVHLVENCIDYLLEIDKQKIESPNKILVLQFFINLCTKNKIGILIIRSARNSKEMSRINKIEEEDDSQRKTISDVQRSILSSHYFYCTQMVFSLTFFKPAFELTQSCILDTLNLNPETELKEMSCLFFQCAELVETLTAKLGFLYEEFVDKQDRNSADDGELAHNALSIQEIKAAFLDFSLNIQAKILDFVKIIPNNQMKSNNLLQNIIKLLLPLNPNFINLNLSSRNFKIGLQIIQYMAKCMTLCSIDDSNMLSFLNALLNQLLSNRDASLHKRFDGYFHDFVRAQNLKQHLGDRNAINILIGSARMMSSCLILYPQLFEMIKLKLKNEVISEIFDQIEPDEKNDPEMEMEKSICGVELLYLLCHNSQTCTQTLSVFMKFATMNSTYTHISNAIMFGDEKMIERAFTVTRAAGFSFENIIGLSKRFHAKRAKVFMEPFPNFQLPTSGLSLNAFSGANKLDTMFNSMDFWSQGQNEKDGSGSGEKPPLVSDVMGLMKLKNDLSARELETMQIQNCELNKNIYQLKAMFDKQTDLMIEKIANVELKDKEILVLNSRLEKRALVLIEITKQQQKADNELQDLRLKLSEFEELNEKKQAEIDELSKLQEGLEEKLKKTKHESKTYKKDVADFKKQKEKLQGDLKDKEEELKKVNILLEKEKQTVNTIRGLLGHQF